MGYKQMPSALAVPGLTDVQKLVLLSIVSHANAEHADSMYWGQGRMAQELGKGRSTINRAMKALEARGLIVRSPNYRKTDDGRSYRSSDTVVVRYDMFDVLPAQDDTDGAIDTTVVSSPGDVDTTAATPPSDDRALPLVSSGQHPSDHRTLPLVSSEHGGSATAAQLNRELNRELEQGHEQGSEIGNLVSRSASADPLVSRSASADPREGHRLRRAQMLDSIQAIARGNDDQSTYLEHQLNLEHLLDDEYGTAVMDHYIEKWSIPKKCTNRYEAGTWLNKFINDCTVHGLIEGNEDEQRNAQLNALSELIEREESAA